MSLKDERSGRKRPSRLSAKLAVLRINHGDCKLLAGTRVQGDGVHSSSSSIRIEASGWAQPGGQVCPVAGAVSLGYHKWLPLVRPHLLSAPSSQCEETVTVCNRLRGRPDADADAPRQAATAYNKVGGPTPPPRNAPPEVRLAPRCTGTRDVIWKRRIEGGVRSHSDQDRSSNCPAGGLARPDFPHADPVQAPESASAPSSLLVVKGHRERVASSSLPFVVASVWVVSQSRRVAEAPQGLG